MLQTILMRTPKRFFIFMICIGIYSSAHAQNVCSQYRSISQTEECHARLQHLTFHSGAVKACGQYRSTQAEENCLSRLANANFHENALQVCAQYRSTDAEENCLFRLKDLTFDSQAVSVCSLYRSTDAEESCMARLGQKNDLFTEIENDIAFISSCEDYSKVVNKMRSIFNKSNERIKTQIRSKLAELQKRFTNCFDTNNHGNNSNRAR